MCAISENFRLDNGNQSIGLANNGISCQSPSVFLHGDVTGASINFVNLKNCSPFGESAS